MIPPKLFGLIGYPVKHSLSPKMHNAAFRALNIDAHYTLFELKPEELVPFFNSLGEKNICGLNVTIPYKEKVITFLNSVSGEAKLIGAVNTIKVERNNLAGFNTDGEGFIKHLKGDLNVDPENKHIIILGAGGAAKAVSVYLAKEKPGSLCIYDIDKPKLDALVGYLQGNFKNIQFRSTDSLEAYDFRKADILINATPIGMKEADPCLVKAGSLHSRMFVYDLIYNPAETKLLALAKNAGARCSNGLGMLLYQGMIAFEIWTGKSAPKDVMRKALEQALP